MTKASWAEDVGLAPDGWIAAILFCGDLADGLDAVAIQKQGASFFRRHPLGPLGEQASIVTWAGPFATEQEAAEWAEENNPCC